MKELCRCDVMVAEASYEEILMMTLREGPYLRFDVS